MYKNAKKISWRRFRRKVNQDGLVAGLVGAVETLARESLFPIAIEQLIQSKNLVLDDRNLLESNSCEIFWIDGYENSYTESSKIPFVAKFPNGYLNPNFGILFDNDKKIVNSLLQPQGGFTDEVTVDRLTRLAIRDPIVFQRMLRSTSKMWADAPQLETVAPLFPYHVNYYHWLVKTLPKVRYIRKYEKITNQKVQYLVPIRYSSYVSESLNLIGVPKEKIIYPTDQLYQTEELIAPSWVAFSAEDFNWLKRSMLSNSLASNSTERNILISRKDATDRHIINREEVLSILNKYGFEEYILSELSVEESINLFNQADIIVGAHGAGLADIIFAEEASIIELYGSRYTTTYSTISDKLGLDYTKIKCEPMYGDIVVDTDKLESVIQAKVNK